MAERMRKATPERDATPCGDCGKPVRLVWFAPNELFNRVTGTVGVGYFCPSCFERRCAEVDISLVWCAAEPGVVEDLLAAFPPSQPEGLTDVEQALVDLDRAVGRSLEAGVTGDADLIDAELHGLDEVRGRIWATYNRASDVLKEADRSG